MQTIFASGNLYATPLTDGFNNAIANPTPKKFGILQDVAIDVNYETKELYGANTFAQDVSRGKGKIGIKAKAAQIYSSLFNDLFFGQTLATGQISDYADNTGSVIPATPYTVTPTPPNSGVWSKDLGVRNANGVPLTRVASAPTTGQYSLAAGVYTFSTADTGTTVYIDYQYTVAASGKILTVNNTLMGVTPTFSIDAVMQSKGKTLIWTFPCCTSSKLSLATKLDDYAIPEFDIVAYANAAGQVFTESTVD